MFTALLNQSVLRPKPRRRAGNQPEESHAARRARLDPAAVEEAAAEIARLRRIHRYRPLGCIIGALVLLWSAVQCPAATVTGTFSNAQGTPTTTTVRFQPLSNPQADGGVIIGSSPVSTSATNGVLVVTLEQGDYQVRAGRDAFLISVPNSASSYNIEDLITSDLTYVYTVVPSSVSLPYASSTVAGKVQTDSDEDTPVVYLKTSVDTLLSLKANAADIGTIASQDADAVSITGGTVTNITDLAVGDGGTGASTAAAARVNLLPAMAGQASKVLAVAGPEDDVEWVAAATGSVTSVDASGGSTGLSISGGPITGSGTLTVGGTLAVASGGTGSTNAATASRALAVPQYVTLADLPTLDGTLGPTTVYCTDAGQEGLFSWVADASAPAIITDPDGTLDGIYYDESTTTDGVWYRAAIVTEPLNVRWFGATADGVTDDTAAIQAAVTVATQNTLTLDYQDNTAVYFPAGEYVCNGTSIYAYGNRKEGRGLTLLGDGKHSSFITTTRSDGTAVFLMDWMKWTARDFAIYGNIDPDVAPYDYRCYGIAMYECDYYTIENVGFYKLSKGLILNNDKLNWGTIYGTDFNENVVGIHSISGQAMTVEAHMAYNGNSFFGGGTAIDFIAHTEGCGVVADLPANFVFPSGGMINFRNGYGEGMINDAFPIMAGVQTTNKVTMSAVGDQVTVTFTNAHHFPYFTTFTVNSLLAGGGGADVTSGIMGARTWNTAPENTNVVAHPTLTFTAGNAITTDLSGHVFELLGPSSGIDIELLSINGGTLGSDAGPILLDHVNKARIFTHSRTPGAAVQYTTNTIDPKIEFVPETSGTWVDWKGDYRLQNVFPDPEFNHGTNWMSSARTVYNCSVIETNSGFVPGDKAMLFHVPDKITSSYLQWRQDFMPTIPATDLNGHRVLLSYWVKALDIDAYAPTNKTASWTIDAAGTGYSDGTATVTSGGRTVNVTLTTAAGGIMNAVWSWNTFATDIGAASLEVTQSGGSSGFITPPVLGDVSLSTEGTLAGAFACALYRGGAGSGALTVASYGNANYIWNQSQAVSRFQEDGWFYVATICYVTGLSSDLRLWFSNSSLTSTSAEGDEQWLIDKLTITIQDDVLRIDDAMRGLYSNEAYGRVGDQYRTITGNLGPSWPLTEDGVAAVFAANDVDSTTTIYIKDEAGTSGAVQMVPTVSTVTETAGSIPVAFTRNRTVSTCDIDQDSAFAAATGKQSGRELALKVRNTDAFSHTLTLNASWGSYGELSPVTIPAGESVWVTFECLGTAETDVDVAMALSN